MNQTPTKVKGSHFQVKSGRISLYYIIVLVEHWTLRIAVPVMNELTE